MATLGTFVKPVVEWVKAGYPAGIPAQDYGALLSILHRRLTADEVTSIVEDLASASRDEDGLTPDEIRALLADRSFETASAASMARVSSHLAAGGWPLASVD